MNSVIQQIKKKTLPILKEVGVKHASIFGSYVRGEQDKKSDIDILIDFPKEKSLFDFVDLKLKLEKALNKKVDLGEYSTVKPKLKEQILNEQIQII